MQEVSTATAGRLLILSSLFEAVAAPERHEVEVVCLRPGLSRNANYYPTDLVRGLAPLFEGARAFADHPGPAERPERSVRDLVGYYKEPRIDESGALRAVLKVTRNADWLWALIEEAIGADGRADLIGVSIDADGTVKPGMVEGRRVRLVESISRLNSCDVVTRASAGGRFERLLQADNQSWWDDFSPLNEQGAESQGAAFRAGRPIAAQQRIVARPDDVHQPVQMGPTLAAPIAGGQVIAGGYALGRIDVNGMGIDAQGSQGPRATEERGSEVAWPQAATESAGALLRGVREAAAPAQGEGTPPAGAVALTEALAERSAVSSLREVQAELQQTRRLLECERSLGKALSACGLPVAIKERLERRFSGRVFETAELDGAIGEEREVLAELTDAGLIRGMGYEKTIRVGESALEKLQRAFDQMFEVNDGERVPALSGIREAYVLATGDREISGVSQPARLLEADVTTASFSYLLGTSMNKRLLKDYQAWPSEWQKFCTITPIKDFKQQDRIRLGAFGSLSTVPEDTAYTTLTLSDVRATYTPAKRGNIVAVTRETIVNDDLYSIKQIPGKLAVAAAFTLAEFVYAFLTATSNIYDGSPLFQKATGHTNSQVTTPGTPNTGVALSSANMQTGVTAMRRQTNLAGKPIGLKPRFLLVPPELEWTAMVLTKSAGAPGVNFNDINPMLGYTEVLVTPQYGSATMWNLVADPRVIDTIEVGFVGGQVNPILFVQDQPLFGNNFTNDVITYKVRHEYGGAVVDYRGFYQGNN